MERLLLEQQNISGEAGSAETISAEEAAPIAVGGIAEVTAQRDDPWKSAFASSLREGCL